MDGDRPEDHPRGSEEDLKRLVSMLGPFHYETTEELERAELNGSAPRYPGPKPLCWHSRASALDRLGKIAITLNWAMRKESNAPRVSTVIKALRQLEDDAGRLRKTLASLDDYTISALRSAGTLVADVDPEFVGPFATLARAIRVNDLPNVSTQRAEPSDQPSWTERLEALSRYAGLVTDSFTKLWGTGNPDVPDPGGNTDLFRRSFGSALWRFVESTHMLYEMCRPNEATGTENGPFFNFVAALYEYATGLPAEERTGIDTTIKRVCSARRRLAIVDAQMETNSKKIRDLYHGRCDSSGIQKHNLETLQKEQRELGEERRTLAWELLMGQSSAAQEKYCLK